MVEAIAHVDVEPGVARDRQFLEPLAPGIAARRERRHDRLRRASLLELRVDAELHRHVRQPAQFRVGTEDLRLDARHHARDGLVADLGEGLLAEGKEGHVRPVAEQQELEVVVPHAKVPLERLLVGLEELMVGGNAAPGVHVRERLEFRQLGLRQCLGGVDQRQHLLAPLGVQALPVAVVVEGALLEFPGAAGDLDRVRHGVAADVHPPVDDAVVDAERGRQAVHAGAGRAQGAVRRLGRDHVERGHRLREVHRVVEPEALIVRGAELHVIGVGGLGAFRAGHHLERARRRKGPRLCLRVDDDSPAPRRPPPRRVSRL